MLTNCTSSRIVHEGVHILQGLPVTTRLLLLRANSILYFRGLYLGAFNLLVVDVSKFCRRYLRGSHSIVAVSA